MSAANDNGAQNGVSTSKSNGSHHQTALSERGTRDAQRMSGRGGRLKAILRDQWDEKGNPDGIVLLGIADNSLCRSELVDYFTAPGRLVLEPRDLTYADGLFASLRVLEAICGLYNEVPDGLYDERTWTPPLKRLQPEHLIIGNGATEIIEATTWALCDPGDGVLLSAPYYNAFDDDVTVRTGAKIVEVRPPAPGIASTDSRREPRELFAVETISAYEEALKRAQADGIRVRAVYVCNPHNPTGCIYPRDTIIGLAAFCAKHNLHLVMDEIYARSVFPTTDIPDPTPFDSILGIDTEKEAGLHPSSVHVISSASKDFSINGFRIGIFISQHNEEMIGAMLATAFFAQTASPAGQLFASMLNDRKYLTWFLDENRRRLRSSYEYVIAFCRHHQIPYVPANAAMFLLIDLRRFLDMSVGATFDQSAPPDDPSSKPPSPERDLAYRFMENKVYVAPGGQYHHPVPGFFRLTFSVDAKALRLGLARIETTLGLQPWIESQPPP